MNDAVPDPSTHSSIGHRSERWTNRLAVALVCVTFPLLCVGGLVTTTQAGMAVPDWPGTYGYNLFLYPWSSWLWGPFDLMVEHGHRLLGALAGMVTIALLLILWWREPRRWVRTLGFAALVAVVAQGGLGGARVLLDRTGVNVGRSLAMLHGCVGPAFFALAIALAVVTSRRWTSRATSHGASPQPATDLARFAALTALLAYAQIVLGAFVRHVSVTAAPDTYRAAVFMHLAMAAALAIHVLLVAARVVRRHRGRPELTRPAALLVAVLVAQLALGAATWVAKYGWPSWIGTNVWTASYLVRAGSMGQALTVTAHMAGGSLLLGLALTLALRAAGPQMMATASREKAEHASADPGTVQQGRAGQGSVILATLWQGAMA